MSVSGPSSITTGVAKAEITTGSRAVPRPHATYSGPMERVSAANRI